MDEEEKDEEEVEKCLILKGVHVEDGEEVNTIILSTPTTESRAGGSRGEQRREKPSAERKGREAES